MQSERERARVQLWADATAGAVRAGSRAPRGRPRAEALVRRRRRMLYRALCGRQAARTAADVRPTLLRTDRDRGTAARGERVRLRARLLPRPKPRLSRLQPRL